MELWKVVLASASGSIAFSCEMVSNTLDERQFAQAVGIAKLATVRTGDGEVYLNSPMAAASGVEDDRGLIRPYEALELCRLWAGQTDSHNQY